MRSIKKKIANLALTLMLVCGLVPTTAFAVEQDASKDQVRVIVENTTLTPETADGLGAVWSDDYWYGTLVDTYVDIDENSTMMSCIAKALEEVDATVVGIDSGYISSINGVGEFSGGLYTSGWMGTLNDWFVNMGFPDFKVSDGTLVAGDVIRVMHTCDMGIDLGGGWDSKDNTSLTALSVDGATLDKTFKSDELAYTATVASDTEAVTIQATAFNKQNNVVLKVGDTEYRRTASVTVEDGAVIEVICGEGDGATAYEVTIAKERAIEPTVIYTGSDWPYSRYYVESLTLDGAVVDYVTGGGSEYHVYLNNATANDVSLSLVAAAGGKKSGNLGINYNDNGQNSKTYDFDLTNGEATVKIYAYKASGAGVSRSGTKTFSFHIAAPNNAPTLAEGVVSPRKATAEANGVYLLNLDEVFADADGDALTYTVSVNGGTPVSTDAAYNMSASVTGTHQLVFTASDGKTAEQDRPEFTVDLEFVNSETTRDVLVNVPAGVTPTFYASNVSGALGSEITSSADGNMYTVKVPENVSHIAWRADGMGMSAEVPEDGNLSLVKTDFVVKAGGEVDAGATVSVVCGDLSAAGANGSYLLLDGVKYSYSAVPSNSAYRSASLSDQDPVSGEMVIDLAMKHFTVTAPKGSSVSAGAQNGYFGFTFADPISVKAEGDKVVYEFAPIGNGSFIRVQHESEDAVTYWEYRALSDGLVYEVTEEMLCLNDDGSFDSSTVNRSFSNMYDLADIYLNINAAGCLNLEQGGKKELNVFRNWFAYTNTISNNGVAIPDVSYKVIDAQGNPSDVVTVAPHEGNSAVADLVANKEGTAIVLVTYDAMTNKGAAGGSQFSAIWPERTGVFVVTVGADGSSIETNMTLNGGALDAEHSPLFYTGEEGASYSFAPEEGCAVTVARPTLTANSLTYSGFSSEGVSVAEDGTVTVTGMPTGRNIVKVEKDGAETYQVITAHKVSYAITDADNNPVSKDNPVDPGETVTIQFTGLTSPAEKLSGVYNYNFALAYAGEDGSNFASSSGSAYGVYNFSSSSTLQRISVTVPSEWDEATYDLTSGYIKLGGFAPNGLGSHRGLTYATGKGVSTGSAAGTGSLGSLPVIQIPIAGQFEPATYAVTLPTGEGFAVEGAEGFESPVAEGGSYSFTVAIADGYEAGEGFAVKANGQTLSAVEGVYTIANVTADQTVTVEGVEKKTESPVEPDPEPLKQAIQDDLTSVPAALADKFSTVEELKAALLSQIVATPGYSAENSEVYDIKLQYSNDGGETWVDATEEDFPIDGITIKLGFPEGTNGETHNFKVAHMFTVDSDRLGTAAGEIEYPEVTVTGDGIIVTLNGLSPVSVSWTSEATVDEGQGGGSDEGTSSDDPTGQDPVTPVTPDQTEGEDEKTVISQTGDSALAVGGGIAVLCAACVVLMALARKKTSETR